VTPGTATPGDVNGDSNIDIIDALFTAQYYVGLNPANFNRYLPQMLTAMET
jgi:hypothetical protein